MTGLPGLRPPAGAPHKAHRIEALIDPSTEMLNENKDNDATAMNVLFIADPDDAIGEAVEK